MTKLQILQILGDGNVQENLYFVSYGPYEYQMCLEDSEKNKEVLIPGFDPEADTHYLGPYLTIEEANTVFDSVELNVQIGIGSKSIQDRSVEKIIKEIFNIKNGCE